MVVLFALMGRKLGAAAVYAVDIMEQDSATAAERLIELLAKNAVSAGQAFERAEKVRDSARKKEDLKKALPKAWTKLISEPDDLLVDLVSETTESLCGFIRMWKM